MKTCPHSLVGTCSPTTSLIHPRDDMAHHLRRRQFLGAMHKNIYFLQSLPHPGFDPLDPGIRPKIIHRVKSIGHKTDKGDRRRQSHMQHVPSACHIRNYRTDTQFAKQLESFPDRRAQAPVPNQSSLRNVIPPPSGIRKEADAHTAAAHPPAPERSDRTAAEKKGPAGPRNAAPRLYKFRRFHARIRQLQPMTDHLRKFRAEPNPSPTTEAQR